MDELAPSLRSAAGGAPADVDREGSSSNSNRDSETAQGEKTVQSDTVVGRCAAVALSTGVDCILDEEVSASREAGRVKGFTQVG